MRSCEQRVPNVLPLPPAALPLPPAALTMTALEPGSRLTPPAVPGPLNTSPRIRLAGGGEGSGAPARRMAGGPARSLAGRAGPKTRAAH